jgi:hypothetical protein
MEIVEAVQQLISVEYDAYNFRRYSRPLIACIITWPVGGSLVVEWESTGSWLLDGSDGAERHKAHGPSSVS